MLTSQFRNGSIAILKLAIPAAAVRLSGRQHASVDRAVMAAASGITLVEGFIVPTKQIEPRPESTRA
jgi:hypothetical protein